MVAVWDRIRRFFRGIDALIVAAPGTVIDWACYEGKWYVGSALFHAVTLLSLALIAVSCPRTLVLPPDQEPTFDAAEVARNAMPPPVERFEVGNAPLDPTELNAETLKQTKAMPVGGQTAKYYDDSSEFEEARGGVVTDAKGPKLGGIGGFSVADLPGPAARGTAGWGGGGPGTGFGLRNKGHRAEILGPAGGTKASERAVGAALNWLYRHQSGYGKWSIDFRHQCKGGTCSGAGIARSDVGATAMGLLPFLAAGETHRSNGPYQQTVAKGLNWLIKQQRMNGDLSGGCDQPMYAHGLATIALCEAYGMTHDDRVGNAARLAVGFIERAQNESTGGWRYVPGEAGDTSVFGWEIMALKSAQLAGLPVNSAVFDNAQRWLHSVAKGEHLGLYSYQPYQQVTPSMTAVGMLCRQYMGIDPKDPGLLEGKRSLLENLPDNQLSRDTYCWYYATQAMHNFADRDWDTWNRKMRRALIETQVKTGCATGSWDPEKPTADRWGQNGGRLMTTSFSVLCLEVYYRYLPLFKTDSLVPKPSAPPGLAGHAENHSGP
jgi:hypothetical protein